MELNSPSLCPDCYRKREAKICDKGNAQKAELKANIEWATKSMQQANERHAKRLARCKDEEETMAEIRRHTSAIVELDDMNVRSQGIIQEVDDEKVAALKAFRDEQGVWGDG